MLGVVDREEYTETSKTTTKTTWQERLERPHVSLSIITLSTIITIHNETQHHHRPTLRGNGYSIGGELANGSNCMTAHGCFGSSWEK